MGWARRGRYFRNWAQAAGSCSKEARVVTKHGVKIKTMARLVERPESLDVVRIEFKELVDKTLGDFGGRQVHLVEGAEQSQQIEPGRFQACPEIGRDLGWGTVGHGPRMA